MNKKLQKGIVAAVSAAMGTGMVAPIYAAAATGTGLDAQYKAAYDATVNATTTKNQKDLTDARVLVDGLYQVVKGTPNEYLATTLSSQLDPAQQVKLNDLYAAMAKADASLAQADINASRDLLLAMPQQWITTFSSANDAIQQKLISKVNDAVVKAEGSKLADDKTAAQALVTDVLTATNNADVVAWANAMQTRVTAVSTAVTVTSTTAIAANAIKVTFNQAPADTSKVAFKVANGATTVATTATWNDTKTEATLTASYSLPSGDYTVNTQNDSADLGTNTVTMKAQEVAKIQITSNVLAVDPLQQLGYVTYKVYDQYGLDITNTTLGNNINWTPSVGQQLSAKNGTLTIQAITGSTLTQFVNTNAVINGYDNDNYVTVSATMPVQQTGALSAITLNKLTSPTNDDFNAGNTSGTWYLDYTALDASGNPTTDYNLINSGIQSVIVGSYLQLASGTTNGVEQDPTDSTKAAIPVQLNPINAANIVSDTPIPITIITKNGKSSTITVTLKKAASLYTFALSAPSQTVSSGQTVTLPFTAYDQNGVALTKYTDLVDVTTGTPKVSINASQSGINGLPSIIRNADGTASIQWTAPQATSSTTVYIQSNVTLTGKSNSLTVTVQKQTAPDSLAVDTSAGKQFFQKNSSLKLDFGYDQGGLTLNDQYGRAIDLTNQDTTASSATNPYYTVLATPSNANMSLTGDIVEVNAGVITDLTSGTLTSTGYVLDSDATHTTVSFTAGAKYGIAVRNNEGVTLHALTAGAASVNYEVYSVGAAAAATDANIGKSVAYTVLNNSDIVGYALDAVTSPMKVLDGTYSNATSAFTVATNDTEGDYAADPSIWGKTSGGAQVRLDPANIVSATVDSSDFSFSNAGDSTSVTSGLGTDFTVYGKGLASGSTGSSTNLTVTVKDKDGNYQNVTTAIKSTTAGSVVDHIGFSASNSTGAKGISVSGNTVTIDVNNTNYAATLAALTGHRVTKFDANGLANTTSTPVGAAQDRAAIYFRAYDQYGTSDAAVSRVDITSAASTMTGATTVSIANNVLTINGTPVHGDYFIMTAISANGKIATLKVAFN